MIDKAKADEKSLRGAIESRAAGFPGSGDSPYVADVEDELARGAKLVDDEKLPYELSRGVAIDLGTRKPGESLTFFGPELLLA